MRRGTFFLFLALSTAVSPQTARADDAPGREYDVATRMILCDCGCSPQSVHDCACGHAAEMREEIASAIRSGQTGQQVIDAYVAKYGEKIRIAPTASGFNLLAWLGPGVALLAGGAASVLILRRWKRVSAAPGPGPREAPPAADDPYVARVEQQLKEYE